jgi:6-phosphofructokinase
MAQTIQTIGIANGGGDCPGLNAVIRGAVRAAILGHGWRVIGINDGFDGLIWTERTMPLDGGIDCGHPAARRHDSGHHESRQSVSLRMSRRTASKGHARLFAARCCENARKLGIDAVISIGGDGTQTIARDLGRLGLPIVGVPKTIDNDLSATEVTFGFDTALHVATDAIDRLHTTAESHGRVMVIEVMGRDAGWIALHSGIAGGADVILLPEIPFTIETVCEKLRERAATGKKFSLVVVAEGVKLPAMRSAGKPFPEPRPGQVSISIGDAIHAHC